MTQPFIKGLELSELFYEELVKPILARNFPGLTYSAALIGPGSDVLGFDTPQSMDHDWGPRLMAFLREGDLGTHQGEITRCLGEELPAEFHGYPTNFGHHEDGTRVMTPTDKRPIDHGVKVFTVLGYFKSLLNLDPGGEIRAADWVNVPENRLLMLTSGRVFHDGLGQLETVREKLHYYPDEVWLYLLAAQWRRIAQEEAFMGRCGQAGDELGSRVVAARLVRDLMRLCFLMERRYAPYIKWLGSAFAQLACAGDLQPILLPALEADTWQMRQTHLTSAYEYAARMHNALGITDPLNTDVSRFYNRPFQVIQADRFVDAIRAVIKSEDVRALPEHLGSIDQFSDSTDALENPERFKEVFR